MLGALYQYALQKELAVRPGFKKKTVKAHISLAADGTFLGIDTKEGEPVDCPDIGSTANGPSKCNILAEKADIVLLLTPDGNIPTKHGFYKMGLSSGAQAEPMFGVCLKALEDAETLEKMQEILKQEKIKPSDVVSFEVNGREIEKSRNYYEWWETFRKEHCSKAAAKRLERCMITGELTTPVDTVAKVSGLRVVGGHSSGDALICFDKNAFCSYGLKQANNAAVSEQAMTVINAALSDLIEKAPVLAGTKFVHWYKEPVEEKKDPFNFFAKTTKTNMDSPEDKKKEEEAARKAADELIQSVANGIKPEFLRNRYYIILLSGAGGRVIVRSYMEGNYQELCQNFRAWFDDLSLIGKNGRDDCVLPKLTQIYYRMLKKEKSGGNTGDRMAKELSGLNLQLMNAFANNHPIQDSVAIRALNYIRSDMYDGDTESKTIKVPDPVACQILKAWLIRKKRDESKEEILLKKELTPENPSVAYQTGRMMAVYAYIQKRALKDVSSGVVERFYTSAMTTPALVIGRLEGLSKHHLAKMENKGEKIWCHNMLCEIAGNINGMFPSTFSLPEQSQFTLGYYQQCAEIYKSNKKDTTEEKDVEEKENGNNEQV